MAKTKRVNGTTPAGGAYSIAHFFDGSGNPVDESKATKMKVIEYDKNGKSIQRTYLDIKKKK